jgi:hypothetical protein
MFATPAAKSDPASPRLAAKSSSEKPSSGAPSPGPTGRVSASATDTVVEDTYRDALAYLGTRRAAGHLDSDIALKAADQLGHRYRERHGETADDPRKRAPQAADQIRMELTGKTLQCLNSESQRLGALLGGLRRPDHQLPAGWEQEIIASTTRLDAIASRISELARSYTRTTADPISDPRR